MYLASPSLLSSRDKVLPAVGGRRGKPHGGLEIYTAEITAVDWLFTDSLVRPVGGRTHQTVYQIIDMCEAFRSEAA